MTVADPPLLVGVPDVGDVGTGHLMRSLALAQAWNDRAGRSVIVAPRLSDHLAGLLARDGVEHLESRGCDDLVADACSVARESSVTVLAIDGYRFGEPLERRLRGSDAALLAFDDGGHAGRHAVDLLTDPTPGMLPEVYRETASGARLLLGPAYASLRREFAGHVQPRADVHDARAPVALLAGGAPAGDVRQWFVRLATLLAREGVEVWAPGVLDAVVQTDDFVSTVGCCLLAVSAGGSTTLELCRLGLPMLVVSAAPNQDALVAGLDAAGAGRSLGAITAVDPAAACAAALALAEDGTTRRAMSVRGRSLVDGSGAARLVVATRAATLQLDRAGPGDAELVWRWANDPVTRRASFSSAPISWAEHERWFAARLRNEDGVVYVARLPGRVPLGQVRFERRDRELVVGTSIDAEQRGRGLAAALISAGADRARVELPADRIVAYVKCDNPRSRRAFLDAGFVPVAGRTGPGAAEALVAPGRPEPGGMGGS